MLQRVIPNHLLKIPQAVLSEIDVPVNHLIAVAGDDGGSATHQRSRERALSDLLYLLDPYDAIHDGHGVQGHTDDIQVIKDIHHEVCGSCSI
jgi:hypothetical protein